MFTYRHMRKNARQYGGPKFYLNFNLCMTLTLFPGLKGDKGDYGTATPAGYQGDEQLYFSGKHCMTFTHPSILTQAGFLLRCPDCLTCLAHLNSIGWTTWAAWAGIKKLSLCNILSKL